MTDRTETYLGDGLYAKLENGMIKLYTDGNVVYLEPEVFQALVQFEQYIRLAHGA